MPKSYSSTVIHQITIVYREIFSSSFQLLTGLKILTQGMGCQPLHTSAQDRDWKRRKISGACDEIIGAGFYSSKINEAIRMWVLAFSMCICHVTIKTTMQHHWKTLCLYKSLMTLELPLVWKYRVLRHSYCPSSTCSNDFLSPVLSHDFHAISMFVKFIFFLFLSGYFLFF